MSASVDVYVLFLITTMGTQLGPVEIWQRAHTFTGPTALQQCVRNGMRIGARRNADSGRTYGPYRAHCERIDFDDNQEGG
jgi:hypothetical protein